MKRSPPPPTPELPRAERRARRVREAAGALQGRVRREAPELFDQQSPKPLALGVHRELARRYGVSRSVVRCMLRGWTGTPRYHRAVLSHPHRYDLDGQAAEAITPAQRAYARGQLEGFEERDV